MVKKVSGSLSPFSLAALDRHGIGSTDLDGPAQEGHAMTCRNRCRCLKVPSLYQMEKTD